MNKKVYIFSLIILVLLSGCSNKGPIEVENKELTILYNQNEMSGKYTGTIENDVPNGTGLFENDDEEHVISYKGDWVEGKISGTGYLEDSDLPIKYYGYDTNVSYKGDAIDGVPNGKGTVVGISPSSNIQFTYEGDFKNGQMEGVGKLVLNTEQAYIQTGHFTYGEFDPTPLEYMTTLGTAPDSKYQITENAKSFLETHSDLFKIILQKILLT